MNYDISNPALAEAGARRVEWAGRRMQVLATVRERSPRRNRSMGSSSPPASM